MKIFICSLFVLISTSLHADPIEKSFMLDYVGTDMDRMFEIKTSKYDKVILDCQTYINGLNFYRNSILVRNYYLDVEQCEDIHSYLTAAKEQIVGICFVIDGGSLEILESDPSDCI